MKSLFSLLIILSFIVLFSCKSGTDKSSGDARTEAEGSEEVIAAEDAPAVSIYWGNLGLRDAPEKDGKWLTSIKMGEKLTSLGITAMDSANNTEYIKVRLMDDKEGWTQSNMVVVNAEAAVLVSDAEIYSRPDLLNKTDKKYSKMDVVAVIKSEGDWIEVKGKRGEGSWVESGWIKSISISYENYDIAVALYTRMAMNEKEKSKKINALEDIIQNQDLSKSELIPEVIQILNSVKSASE
ncbi:MAG: hypothetical protein ISS19_08405 [Bacteroidales bacterium]|nr:hypothetical protein [Bacteroidales bacterium]